MKATCSNGARAVVLFTDLQTCHYTSVTSPLSSSFSISICIEQHKTNYRQTNVIFLYWLKLVCCSLHSESQAAAAAEAVAQIYEKLFIMTVCIPVWWLFAVLLLWQGGTLIAVGLGVAAAGFAGKEKFDTISVNCQDNIICMYMYNMFSKIFFSCYHPLPCLPMCSFLLLLFMLYSLFFS